MKKGVLSMIQSKKGKVRELGIGAALFVGIAFIIVGILMNNNNSAATPEGIATINHIAWMFIGIGAVAVIGVIIAGITWLSRAVGE